jgi:hypothetical protein
MCFLTRMGKSLVKGKPPKDAQRSSTSHSQNAGRQITQSVMWSSLVVLFQPLLGLLSNFIQALKHKHVEHCFPISAIEALNETILHRLTGLDEFERHAVLLGMDAPVRSSETRTELSKGNGRQSRIPPASVEENVYFFRSKNE